MGSIILCIHSDSIPNGDGNHSESDHLINDLISAANTNDRFKLLENEAILSGNLTNPIHPLFHQLKQHEQMQQGLQLASQFLLHDKLLEFFVPLLYGRVMHDLQTGKKYMCDPLIRASKAKKALLLTEARQTLECLAVRVKISFISQKQRTWARTIIDDSASTSEPCCCRAFQTQRSPKIELTEKFVLFYRTEDGYAKATRSARFRHDFLFAITLVHEVVHAVGVMRRGDLSEPRYRLNFPETEWGYAWENFMFGCIINPQDNSMSGTHILMRKIWADIKTADENGGKEYSDVSMSWIAQWFRKETWDMVEKAGPTAISPPTAHFKIQISHSHGAWIVRSDNSDVRNDIVALYRHWQTSSQLSETKGCSAHHRNSSHLVYFNELTATELQVPNVPTPQRVRDAPKPTLLQTLLASKRQSAKKPVRSAQKCTSTTTALLVDNTSACSIRRKRPRGEIDDLFPPSKKHTESLASTLPGLTPAHTRLVAACRASSPCCTRQKRRANDEEGTYLSAIGKGTGGGAEM